MYSRGRRGAPAKGVGRVTGARVQISPSPPTKRNLPHRGRFLFVAGDPEVERSRRLVGARGSEPSAADGGCSAGERVSKKTLSQQWVMSLAENLNKGMGIARRHLYYKCETCDKNRRKSNAEVQFRNALSFLLFMSDILYFAKSDIALRAVILFGFASQCYSIRHETRVANSSPAARDALGDSRIPLRKQEFRLWRNILAHRRIKLA